MSWGSDEEKPRQNSAQFQANDTQAKQKGGDKQLSPTKSCPKQNWKLKVNVTAQVNSRKPKVENVEVSISWKDSSLDAPTCNSTADDKASTETLEDSGAREGTCRAEAKGWYLDAEKTVTLNDGDNKTVDLILKPLVWVAFKAIEEQSGAVIENLSLHANLTDIGDHKTNTPKDTPVEVGDLKPGGVCKIVSLAHDSVLWEAVGDITSA
jgi:hypothetical protein